MRGVVLDLLRPLVSHHSWVILPGRATDSVTRTTVFLTLNSIERFPQAPVLTRQVNYTLTILQPPAKTGDTDDALDDAILTLLDALDDIEGLAWTKAERGVTGSQTPGFDITISFTHTKEN